MAGRATIGTYIGNGAASRPITGVGFQPQAVASFILNFGFGEFCFRVASMVGGVGMTSAGTVGVPYITSLDADGFTVATSGGFSGNQNTIPYHWIAWDDPAGDEFAQGTYTGDGTNPRTISCGNCTPDAVWCGRPAGGLYSWRSSHSTLGNSFRWFNSGSWVSGAIIGNALNAFVVDSLLNANGVVYYWTAWKQSDSFCAVGRYTGDGGDNRAISHTTGFQFSPSWVIIDTEQVVSGAGCAMHMNTFAVGDSSINVRSGFSGSFPNIVQQNLATGFEVGTDFYSNANTERYNYTSFGGGLAIPSGGPGVGGNPPNITRANPLYPGMGTGSPGSYEYHKSIRKAMRTFNNLRIGD